MKEFCRKRQLRRSGKRWLAVLLSVSLTGTMLPVTARAETGETQESGYEQEEENASVSENDTADNEPEDEEDIPGNASEPEDDPAPSDDEEQADPDEKDEVEDDTAIAITAWQWIDEEDIIDPKTGNMALPFANKNCPAYFDDVIALLPTQILATVENAEDAESESEETITLEEWSCEEYPKEGAYTGSLYGCC
ncbi:MAG: hypothetical protein PUF03_09550 [Lachnospiraceae bacterium]|nr:hypothetical protein [Lachnospiraceae bacterium]